MSLNKTSLLPSFKNIWQMFSFVTESPVEETAAESRLTPEEKMMLMEQKKQEKLAEKIAKKEEMRKKWEEEKLRRKEEKAKVYVVTADAWQGSVCFQNFDSQLCANWLATSA